MDENVFVIALIGAGGGLTLALISIVGGLMRDVAKRKQYETSRREIAAYIAEGSMSPEEGRMLLETESKGMRRG